MKRQLKSALQNLATSQEQEKQRAGLPRTSWDPVKRRGRANAPRNRELDLRRRHGRGKALAELPCWGKVGLTQSAQGWEKYAQRSWAVGPKGSWVCSLTQGNCCTRLQKGCNKTQVYMMQPSPHDITLRSLPKISTSLCPSSLLPPWFHGDERGKIWT